MKKKKKKEEIKEGKIYSPFGRFAEQAKLWQLVLHRAAGELSLIVTDFEGDCHVTTY